MEDDDDNNSSSNQSTDDGNQNPNVQQFLRTNFSRKEKRSQLFWYDIRNFTDSLIIEILARSIFRFKLVCKHWQTLISHPSFYRFYSSIFNSNTSSSSSSFRILYRYIYASNYKEFLNRLQPEIFSPSESSVLLLSIYEEREQFNPFKVLAISSDLILCCVLGWGSLVYYICDPVTRQCITLPKTRAILYCEGLITRVNQDHMLTGYTVAGVDIPKSPSNYINIEMFSSESGELVGYQVDCVVPIQLLKRGGGPIYCYGAFHWLTHIHGMVAFDPFKDPKSVRLIPLPNDRDLESEHNQDGAYRLCGECKGTLRYFEVAHDPTKLYFLNMWIMKDYEKGEWCCEFKVRRSDLHCSDPELSKWLLIGTFLPISFHQLNLNVVYLRCIEVGWIVSYDVVNRRLDVACKPIDVVERLSWRVVIPFVLPRWLMLHYDHPHISGSRLKDLEDLGAV